MESGLVSPAYACSVKRCFQTTEALAEARSAAGNPLGSLMRRYHANLAEYLYRPKE